MGGKKQLYGATHKDALMFYPEDLNVITDEKDPRYDPRVKLPISENMVQSILAHGVRQSLTVYIDGGKPYVDDGLQRRANAIEANRRSGKTGEDRIKVPCLLARGDETELFEISLMLNEHRSQPSPIDRARKMRRLLDMGRDEKRVAMIFDCTVQSVKDNLRLLDCSSAVQRAVESAEVSASVARKLADLPRADQKAALDEMIASGATKGEKAKRAISKKTGKGDKPRMRSRKFLERWRDEIMKVSPNGMQSRTAALINFILGDDAALPSITTMYREAAERAEGKPDETNQSPAPVSQGRNGAVRETQKRDTSEEAGAET